METKLNKTIKKKTETKKKVSKISVEKKTVTKNNKKKKGKGFTLIELLAVIIILGVLMIIAIPSVTTYISNSRKSAYVDTAKEIVGGARNLVNEGKLEMYDPSVTYYIPVGYIKTENGTRSPYGDFTQAYVGVTFDGTGYNYYWISNDTSGQGIKNVTSQEKLDNELISSDIKDIDIRTTVETTGIGGRNKILILGENGTWGEEKSAIENINEDSSSVIVYPDGKGKSTVEIGDIVKIGNEEFFVIKELKDNKLTLIARYNLNVGPNKKEDVTEGIQNKDVIGYNFTDDGTRYATLAFSSTDYWNGKVGNGMTYPGVYCSTIDETNCAYVYDSNSLLYPYVQSYKQYLEGIMGRSIEASLLPLSDAAEIWHSSYRELIFSTSFWLGNPSSYNQAWSVGADTNIYINRYNSGENVFGVRPIIII